VGRIFGRSAAQNRRQRSAQAGLLEQLSNFNEKEKLALHGMGPGPIPKLRSALEAEGLSFRSS
jgi:hypothetical protein